MSMNFTSANEPSPELPESDTPLFAANPIWERSAKKKRGFGGSRRAATAGPVTTDPLAAPMTEGAPMTAAPYTRTTTAKRKDGGVPGVAIAAGVIVLGGLAAAGWYATQPHDNGVAQLTPGAPGAGALTPSTETTTVAANTPPPEAAVPAPKSVTTTTRTTTHVAAATPRVRPASRAPSAAASGVNASATAALPDAPQAYSGGATPPAAVTAPAKAWNIPSTPPVEPAPAPSASSPATTPATPAPQEAAPPVSAAPQ